jgi:predicted N-acetyltransferase YhbS
MTTADVLTDQRIEVNKGLLREATDEDIPTLVAVLRAAFEEYRERYDPPSGAHNETVEKVRQKLTTARAVVVEVDRKIVGCVFFQPLVDYMYLGRLAVLPAYRRNGLGQALVAYVETQAKINHLPCVRLGVRIGLQENRAYYERMGYRLIEYKAHEGYTEPTYVILEKSL